MASGGGNGGNNVSERQEKRSFMEDAEVNISQDGGNVLIGDDSKVYLLGKKQNSGENKDVIKRDIQEHTNDLMFNQPQTTNSNIPPPRESFVVSESTPGSESSSLNQSTSSLYTDAVGLPPTAKGKVGHSQRYSENVERLGARMKEPRSPVSSPDIPRRRHKSDEASIKSKPVSSAKSALAQSYQQNISHNSNIQVQLSRQVKLGRSLHESEGQRSQKSIGTKRDQSNTSGNTNGQRSNQSQLGSLNEDENDLQSRIVVESSKAVNYPGNKELHFCVQEKDEWVQIGDCCVIVELNIDDKLVDKIKQQGDFTAEINTGEVMVNLRWGDLQKNVKAYRSSLKVTVTQHFQKLEHAILQELFLQRCEKLIKTVRNIFEKCNSDARIVDITKGCFQFNFVHLTQESVEFLHSQKCIQEIQIFLTDLLITERIRGLAGSDGEILRVTSLKDQSSLINNSEEMKKYGLLSPERVVTSKGGAVSQAELNTSEIRYRIEDLRNEVQLIKTTIKSQNETMQMDRNAIQDQLSGITELLQSLFPKINNLEEKVTQIRDGESHIHTSGLSPQTDREDGILATHFRVPSGSNVLSPQTESEEGIGTTPFRVPSGSSVLSPQTESEESIERTRFKVPSESSALVHQAEREESLETTQELVTSEQSLILNEHLASPESGYQSLSAIGNRRRMEEDDIPIATDTHASEDKVVTIETDLQRSSTYTPEPNISKKDVKEIPGYAISDLLETLFGDRDILKVDPGDKTRELEGATAAVPDEDSDEAKGFLYQFADFININDLLETIKLLMQEEDDHSPRASGIDTVLCLDLAQSMEGTGFVQMKHVVNTYLDGVEENATERGLEENIAMTVTVDGVEIPPHIILISDGNITSLDDVSAEVIDVTEKRREMIISVILRMKQCGFNFPITCVPVGDFKHTIVGKAVKFLSEMNTEHISVEDVIKNMILGCGFDLSDKIYLEKMVQIYKKPQPNYIFFDDFYVEEYSELPPLGSRVKRKNKASHLEGTIVSHLSESKIEVIWDSGDPKTYNITKDDSDLIVTDKPRIMTSQEINPPIGTLVKRGTDWRDINSHKLRYPVEVVDRPDIVVSWQWKDEAGTWWRYTKEQMKTIEEAYSAKQPTCVLGTEEHQKRLLLDRFEVRDVATGIINKIARKQKKK
ncbi:hypothetical protein KUTeg_018216 [Tegillarca granosa]|uniref:WWE domain-containing protein n=1 Tax=Tegillarca granosa TaxID=220873 RepID=A0ABQ9EN07_TEGGR|nr:hypothetical protein KUTeg_018216 [Tegillarca granosa]